MGRGLSDKFMRDLKEGGSIHCFLEAVKRDDTLSLEIRDNYVNIYYRGGNLFRITPKEPSSYSIYFDTKAMGFTVIQ
jgi:hypothetical protein